ncbi:hypothetical protein [Frankia sp. AgKG'84/4]|uniref:hypothetical protein n=1 Tax=Frankia sp. AgKG'84/4 TaxID=573490 RepID=UPI00200E986F|nr:hypothetical protein [Frankia sp. AgKG'84/4]MCL9797901.1 hypothetical protein [Frankia sp. AgKG'84/4]
MTLGLSVFLVVLGAALRYALTWRVAGVDLPVLGLILIVAGIVTSVICVLRAVLPFAPTGRGTSRAGAVWPPAAPRTPLSEPSRRPTVPLGGRPDPADHPYGALERQVFGAPASAGGPLDDHEPGAAEPAAGPDGWGC